MRIAILGTGALGCLFAAHLARRAEVWMLGTWAEGIAAVRRSGVTVRDDKTCWHAVIRATNDPAEAPPADLALLLVKSYQTERAAAWAARVLASDGVAVTLQNGLDNGPRLAAAVGTNRTAVGVTYNGATLLGPGDVRHTAQMPTYIGDAPTTCAHVRALVACLSEAGLAAETADDPDAMLWRKALANAAINPLTALWRVPNGLLLATPDRRALLATAVEEVVAVADAAGVPLSLGDPVAYVEGVCRGTAGNRSSMLQDIERARRTEIDSINGVIVHQGRKLGLSTPVNETLWQLVRGLEQADQGLVEE